MHLLSFSEQIGMIQADSLSLPDVHANVSPSLTQAAHICLQALAGTLPQTGIRTCCAATHTFCATHALPGDNEPLVKVRNFLKEKKAFLRAKW